VIRIGHWLLIPVFAIGVVVLGGITGTLSRKVKTVQRLIVRKSMRLSGTITEPLRNIELVKSLGLTWPEIRRLQGYTRRILDLEMERVHQIRALSFLQGKLAHADTIYVLERGRVIETGSHDALVAAQGLYAAMWRQQVGERESRPAHPVYEPTAPM
jgi:ABC-type multidrug transport system fused ATPase/permease subunit